MDLTTREPQVMVGRTVKIATVAFAIAVGVYGLQVAGQFEIRDHFAMRLHGHYATVAGRRNTGKQKNVSLNCSG
jgi:hypothetical protein